MIVTVHGIVIVQSLQEPADSAAWNCKIGHWFYFVFHGALRLSISFPLFGVLWDVGPFLGLGNWGLSCGAGMHTIHGSAVE